MNSKMIEDMTEIEVSSGPYFNLYHLETYQKVSVYQNLELIIWKKSYMYDGAKLWNSIPNTSGKVNHFLPFAKKSLLTWTDW